MPIVPDTLTPERRYFLMVSCIIPRPIAWVGTVNEDGSHNLAPYSFFNGVSATPPLVMLGIGPSPDKKEKDSLRNIKRTGELTVSIPRFEQAEQVEATAEDLPYGEDEFVRCGLTPAIGEVVPAPYVAEAGVAFECTVERIWPIPRGGSTLVLAEVRLFHLADEYADARQCLNPDAFEPLARLGGGRYASVGKAFKVGR
ncbi:MAG: flavin reductase family protein [Deltaproteobacteria bacterium]|nr:flavin reductase family protein [Deltaproteobacteria bacterium]